MKRSGKILLEGTVEEFKKHCKGADNREYLLINTKEIKKDGIYTIYQLDSNTERVVPISAMGKYGKLPFIPYDRQYLTFVATSEGTFTFSGQTQGGASNCLISYSTDNGSTWSVPSQIVEVNVQSGDKVMWKGEMNPGTYGPGSWLGIGVFSGSTATFNAQGNPKSLLYGDNFFGQTLKSHSFYYLFTETEIVNANNLSMDTILTDSCYQYMFQNCTALTQAPKLPATTLVSACYYSMFKGCTSLTTAPQLPATTLANWCYYQMFSDCTSLTTAPQLLATTLTYWCYQSMFKGCTSLTKAPELPATVLENACYSNMFQGCTSLDYIKMLATDISESDCLSNWVNGVAASGTFVKAASMSTLPSGDSGIPNNWTVEDATE